MGNTNSNFFKVCGSTSKKAKKSSGKEEDEEEEGEENKNREDINIIRRNQDKYFSKEDYDKIIKKYPAFKEWIDQSANPQAIEKPKQRTIRFEELKIIGQGSYGRVFMGFDAEKGCIMAVKQVALGDSNNQDQQEKIHSLETEINLLSMFSHKNIVKYYGSHRNENNFNIYLEYVSGGSIASLLQKYGPMPENLIRVYSLQILEGLEYLHVRNTIHRDIKGANILVDSTGVCKLADFGTAKKISSLVDNDSKGMNSLKGTIHWMAPEIIKQTSLGRFCDIWSVGCTVIEMATGKAPWSSIVKPNSTIVGTLYQIAKAKSPPPFPSQLSSIAIDFLKQCFKINPNERPNVLTLLQHKFVTGIQSICPSIESVCEEKELLFLNPSQKKVSSQFTIKNTKSKSSKQEQPTKKDTPKAEQNSSKSPKEVNPKSSNAVFTGQLQVICESPDEEKDKGLGNYKDGQKHSERVLRDLTSEKENRSLARHNIENKHPMKSKSFLALKKQASIDKESPSMAKGFDSMQPRASPSSRPLGKSSSAAQTKKKGYANLSEEKNEIVNKAIKENISPENIKQTGSIYDFDENQEIKIEIKETLLKSAESQGRRKSAWWSQCKNSTGSQEAKDNVEGQLKSHHGDDSHSRDSDHEFSLPNESPLKYENSASISQIHGRNKGLHDTSLANSEYNLSILRKKERREQKIIVMLETPTVELSIIPNPNHKASQEESKEREISSQNRKSSSNSEDLQSKESFDIRKFNMSEDLNNIFPKFEANNSPLGF